MIIFSFWKWEIAASRSVSIFKVGVWTRPTFKVFPYRQEKSRVALMPISQSAFARQRADAKSAP